MNFQLKCLECGSTCWVLGCYDPSTNATDLDEESPWEWGRGEWPECEHGNFEIVNSEYIDDY